MSLFGSYSGKQLLDLKLKQRDWLIENLLQENDSVMFVGNEKSGKSLLMFQIACSLTTQHPLIDKYNVPTPCRVTYCQLEGELGDSQDRMKRMIKCIDFNPDMFHLLFLPPQELQDHSKMLAFRDTIKKYWLEKDNKTPDVVIIDPIYFAFRGSLSKDDVVREFLGNIRILKDSLNCAVILVHHTHKQRFDYTGDRVEEGDEATFGSKFLKAWADHILLFIHDTKHGTRTLSCTTQRSGKIVRQANLRLVEPDPLYFEEQSKNANLKDLVIVELLKLPEFKDGISCEDICAQLNISRDFFYKSIKQPLADNLLEKIDTVRPVLYRYISHINGKRREEFKKV